MSRPRLPGSGLAGAGLPGSGLAGAAVLIAGLTLLARVVGVGRWFAFSATVGSGCTGTAYSTANQLPNVLFEVVAGGSLAGAVVPVLAGLLEHDRRADADRTASALLSWAVLVLLPVSVLLAALAGPLTGLFVGQLPAGARCTDLPALVALSARMLLVFAPQVLLYGIGVVLTGVLQAHRRFAAPALAPLLSSVTVIVAYLLFGLLDSGADGGPGRLPGRGPELVLSIGTTLGVLALSLPLLVPVHRAGIRLRPTLRFPAGVVARLRPLALAGLGALLAQQLAVLVTVKLANAVGGDGALTVVQYVQAVYLLPYAVLAVPVAVAAFPRLAELVARDRREDFAGSAAAGTRTVIWLSLLGTAVLAAVAPAVQDLFTGLDRAGGGALPAFGDGLTVFAAGLLGWGLVAYVGRALYALHAGRAAAVATVAGWLAVVPASLLLVLGMPLLGADRRWSAVVGLGAGTSIGLLLAGALLLRGIRASAGPGALAGVRRALLAGGLAAVLAAAAGRGLAALLPAPAGRGPGPVLAAIGLGLLCGLLALVVFVLVAVLSEPGPGPGGGPDRPRVLLVLATSGGGTGRHVAQLADWLGRQGVPVRIAGPVAGAAAFGWAGTGPGFEPVEIADRPRPAADLRAVVRLRGLAGQVDVLHAHGLRAGALAVLAARSRARRPRIVVTLHNALVGGGRIAAVHAVLARIVARGADDVLVVSGDLGDQIRALGARRVERALVPAPPRPVTGDVPQLGPGHQVLTVARLAPQKGLDLLLDAVALLADLPVTALIAGDGPLQEELADRIGRDALPVRLLGRRDDVPELLAAVDLVLVPSVWEGQPLIVQEALRTPVAVVATDVGGTREVTGDAAVLVPAGDPVALAAAVRDLLLDPDRRQALRSAAARRARELPTEQDAGRQVLAHYHPPSP